MWAFNSDIANFVKLKKTRMIYIAKNVDIENRF